MIGKGAMPLVLGTLAVLVGAAFLWDVGALPGMASRNLIAYLLGLALGWASHKAAHRKRGAAILFVAATVVLGLVVTVGTELEGVRRWLPLGPLHLQPALLFAPLLLAIAASREGRHWRIAILIPLLLVALQPDAATLVAMALGVAGTMAAASGRSKSGWSARRIAVAAGAVGVATVGLLIAGIQTPPPVAFVEGTVGIAVTSGGTALLLHFAALALMIAALLSRAGPAELGLAAYFTVAALAAVFWAFPMPIAGAGPSHMIGFGIAIGWLVEGRRHATSAPASVSSEEAGRGQVRAQNLPPRRGTGE